MKSTANLRGYINIQFVKMCFVNYAKAKVKLSAIT